MSSTFWLNKPNILIDVKQPLIPNNNLSCETNINAITKIVIVIRNHSEIWIVSYGANNAK